MAMMNVCLIAVILALVARSAAPAATDVVHRHGGRNNGSELDYYGDVAGGNGYRGRMCSMGIGCDGTAWNTWQRSGRIGYNVPVRPCNDEINHPPPPTRWRSQKLYGTAHLLIEKMGSAMYNVL